MVCIFPLNEDPRKSCSHNKSQKELPNAWVAERITTINIGKHQSILKVQNYTVKVPEKWTLS